MSTASKSEEADTTEWKTLKLGEVITLQRGYDITKKEQNEGSYDVISSSGFNSTHDEYKVEGPGVIVGRKGSIGTTYYSEDDYWPHDTTLWVKDFKGNFPKFVYYFLKNMRLERFDVGASNPTLNRNHVHKIEINWPTLTIQKKIASVLTAFDDLIENNKRRIEILEEMAESIYREWFVNFNFPGSEDGEMKDSDVGFIPENWSIETFSEIAHFQNGYSFSGEHWQDEGKPIVKISELKNGITDQTDFYHGDDIDEKYYIDDGDLIFSWSASLYIDIWKKGPALLNQHLYKVMPKDDIELNFVHRSLVKKLEEFRSRMRGTTMQHIRKSDLEEVKVAVPPSEIREQFDQKIDPIKQELLSLHKQNQTLRQTRDLLLARLISGEIEV